MALSSINFKPCKAGSEAHNTREKKPDYLLPEREGKYWSKEYDNRKLSDIRDELENNYIKYHPQRKRFDMRTEPIREAVVNIDRDRFRNEDGKIDIQLIFNRLHQLNVELKKRYKINPLQMHIHGDEGSLKDGKMKINWHAHVVYAWQDPDTGKSIKLNRSDMSAIQTLCAETLGMERGKINSSAERLEHAEYREQMKRLDDNIEQKKNVLVAVEREIKEVEKQITELEVELNLEEKKGEKIEEKKRGIRI